MEEFDQSDLMSIRCTLADLQLVQSVLIDVTVSASRDYGILTTGICDVIEIEAARRFGSTVQELKNIAMQLKQDIGWVPTRVSEKWTARKRKKEQKDHRSSKKFIRRGRSPSVESAPENNADNENDQFVDLHMEVATGGDSDNEQTVENVVNTEIRTDIPDQDEQPTSHSPQEIGTQESPIVIKEELPEYVMYDEKNWLKDEPEISLEDVAAISDNIWSNTAVSSQNNQPSSHTFLSHSMSHPRLHPSNTGPGPSHTATSHSHSNPHQAHPHTMPLLDQNRVPPIHDNDIPTDGLNISQSPGSSQRNSVPQYRGNKQVWYGDSEQVHMDRSLERSQEGYPCTVCGRTFTLQGNLKRHMKIHLGLKPHQCNICGKSFLQKVTLDDHRRRTHDEDMPYKCQICNKGFVRKCLLEEHGRKHINEMASYS